MISEEITMKSSNSENSNQSIYLSIAQAFPIQHLKIRYSFVFIKKNYFMKLFMNSKEITMKSSNSENSKQSICLN